jgi:transposase
VPRNRGKNATLLSSMTLEGMGCSLPVEGATSGKVFETYVGQILVPTLRKGQVVLMDNLSAHKGERVRELIECRGCELVYLPSYSPDFNPIEEAFSKRSRGSCARPKPGRKGPCSRRARRRCPRSPQRTPAATSSTAATGDRFNHYGERCKKLSEKG